MNIFPSYNDTQRYLFDAHGLANSGNKCYFNSMLQVLISCPLINKYMSESKAVLAQEYTQLACGDKLIIHVIYTQMNAHGKGKLVEAASQEDAHEALISLMEVIERIDKQLYINIYNCLFHRLYQAIKCKSCGYTTEDKFEELMFHFDTTCNSIQDYINDEEVQHRCDKCSPLANTTHIKSQRISRLGPIIFIAYKQYASKQQPHITTTFEFDALDKQSRHTYTLIGHVQHSGTRDGGHYYSVCKRRNGVFILNDSSISPSQFNIDSNTYILAYVYTGTTMIIDDPTETLTQLSIAH